MLLNCASIETFRYYAFIPLPSGSSCWESPFMCLYFWWTRQMSYMIDWYGKHGSFNTLPECLRTFLLCNRLVRWSICGSWWSSLLSMKDIVETSIRRISRLNKMTDSSLNNTKISLKEFPWFSELLDCNNGKLLLVL